MPLSLRLAPWLAGLVAVSAPASPNVLLVIVDDFGLDACALYAEPGAAEDLAPMPNLTALAAAGLQFTQAYTAPVCSPTRAALLTGRHGFRTGVGAPTSVAAGNALSAAEFTLPRAIATADPTVALKHFGKWHLGAGPTANLSPVVAGGWPSYAGSIGGAVTDYFSWTKVETDGTPGGTTSRTVTTYATTDVVDDAEAWITEQRDADRTFFAWVAFNTPHTPLHKPPAALSPSYASLSGSAADLQSRPTEYYDAALEAFDTELGRLLAAVDAATTTVIVMGDNGTPRRVLRAPYRAETGKDTLYDGGVRVPFVVRGPTVADPGAVTADLVHVADLYPTVLELLGLRPAAVIPASIAFDGLSFTPILAGGAGARSHVYVDAFDQAEPTDGGRMVSTGSYKLIALNTGATAFYHLPTDPTEASNLLLAPLDAEQQRQYDRLRWWLGGYTEDDVPSLTAANAAGTTWSADMPVGVTATLWRCDELSDAFWSPVASAVATTNPTVLTDIAPPANQAFYTLRVGDW